jgi:plasmid stabilization system protein ParE
MSYNIIISAFAQRHLKESYKWYESQRISLGKEFRAEAKAAIDNLADGMADYQIYKENIRKTSLRRFPYYIYYERIELAKEVVILAVLHVRRDPKEIERLFE